MTIESNDKKTELQLITARSKDVGGIPVARVLPTRERRLIGAWCFLDHAGPTVFKGNSEGMKVAPHPHTGLQTFTWMIEGEVCSGIVNLVTNSEVISSPHKQIGDNYGETYKTTFQCRI